MRLPSKPGLPLNRFSHYGRVVTAGAMKHLIARCFPEWTATPADYTIEPPLVASLHRAGGPAAHRSPPVQLQLALVATPSWNPPPRARAAS